MNDEWGLTSLFRYLETYVANPILRVLLRSPLHVIASDWLLLLSYRGRRSGTRYTTPVAYQRDGDAIVVTTLREPVVWWRNFRESHPATLWIEGEPVRVRGRAILDPDTIVEWLETLEDRGETRLLGFLGVDSESS